MTTYTAPERFAVSHIGMRQLHANRPPWQLVKELIQNAWDEAPEATVCKVFIKPARNENAIIVNVTDDGPGFSDLSDAWTLMKHTDKRADPQKRGRFNMGEKEIISVALEATIETVGNTVSFPRMGSRIVAPNQRTSGTSVTTVMPWDTGLIDDLILKLQSFRPTDCSLVINAKEVVKRQPVAERSAILPTVLQNAPDQPMRPTRRRTTIDILEPLNNTESWLYEMGIPIQTITTPWDIDVLQKVPMPPNRDTISESYLSDLYAEIINQTHDIMQPDQFASPWVKQAIEDERAQPEAVVATVTGRYGDRVLITSPDADANMKAAESGYELINPRTLTPTERKRFREDAGVQTTKQLFGRSSTIATDHEPQSDEQTTFAAWVTDLAAQANLHATIRFFNDHTSNRLADCTSDTAFPIVRFNTALLPEDFLQPPFGRPQQLELIFHELAHALANKPMEHGPAWGEAVAEVSAILASPYMQGATAQTTPKE